MPDTDHMNVAGVIEKINAALPLQYRSALQYTISAGSVYGFDFQSMSDRLASFGQAELEDARLLVEKVSALDADATNDVAPPRLIVDPAEAVDWLIESETDCIEAIHAVIPETGQEGRSEALEHLLEHIIMRKQNQVDFLLRASAMRRRGNGGSGPN